MDRKFFIAALVAPLVAFAPVSAWAHHCSTHHKHHARGADKQSYGSSQSMKQKRDQDMNSQDNTTGTNGQGAGGSDQNGSRRQGI